MNEELLLKFFSRSLKSNVHRLNVEGEVIETICELVDIKDPFLSHIPRAELIQQAERQYYPLLFSYDRLSYALVPASSCYYLVGPVRITPSTVFQVKVSSDSPIELSDSIRTELISMEKFQDHIFLLWNINEEKTKGTESEMIAENVSSVDLQQSLQKRYTNLLFTNAEYSRHHNPYSQELREQASIEKGDVEELKRTFAEKYTGEIGVLAKTELRNYQNLGIALTTLASRSAMRGGLPPEVAYSLSDSYIQQMEEIYDPQALLRFMRNMEIHYTTLVKEYRDQKRLESEKNIPVEQCKNYIFSHLHDRITVDVLASELGYNSSYLSHLFKSVEGIGISDFIQKEKINRAKNLLIYTQYSFSEIATYLGFSSQSHFGSVFKKHTNETPAKYRQREKSDAFLQ